MIYIIMCGGRYHYWQKPRQLTEINGEPIVGRTIRLLREQGVQDIAISTHDKRFECVGVPLLEHDNGFDVQPDHTEDCWVSAFYPTSEPACYLFGDVVYSSDAIRTIVTTQTDSIQFFASAPPFDHRYIKPYAEPFAFKVVDQVRFRAGINYVKANMHTGIFNRHPIAWELWQVLNGYNVRDINYDSYVVINDYTCDIDSKSDIDKLMEVMRQ